MRLTQPLDDLFQSKSYVRVLRALDALPLGIDASTREIARRAGISHPTAAAVLDNLRKQGFVHIRRTLLADEYRLNEDHVLAGQARMLVEWERRLPGHLRVFLAETIHGRAPWVSAAYLYGSALRDDMKPESDLDVAAICPRNKEQRLQRLMAELSDETAVRFGNRLSVVIGTRPISQLAAPGHRGYRLWRTIAKEGELFLPGPEA